MSLQELTAQLDRFFRGELALDGLRAWFEPILVADPLDVEQSVEAPWRETADETRLFWRLLYLFEHGVEEVALRAHAGCIVTCLSSTHDASVTLELLPLLLDQSRLLQIVEKHLAGVISRTGFLGVLAESGYPSYVKLWLEHASPSALQRMADLMASGAYSLAASVLERRPE